MVDAQEIHQSLFFVVAFFVFVRSGGGSRRKLNNHFSDPLFSTLLPTNTGWTESCTSLDG